MWHGAAREGRAPLDRRGRRATLRPMTNPLASLGPAPRVAVIGASGGIGSALVRAVAAHPGAEVLAFSRSGAAPEGAGIAAHPIDIEDEASIAAAAAFAGPVDAVLVATGWLHDGTGAGPEKDWRQITPEGLARAFRINAAGPVLVARHFADGFARGQRAILGVLSARVGSISDNRSGGWYAYRASKAALNQLMRTFAIEAARKRPLLAVACLQPGTVETPLSAPFAAASGGRGTHPDTAARRLLAVLDAAGPETGGALLSWDGTPIPP